MVDLTTFWPDLANVFTPLTLSVALLAGLFGGIALSQPHPPLLTRRAIGTRAIGQALMVAFLASLYYAGRLGESIVQDDGHAGRVVGAWLLWLVFSVGVVFGLILDNWWNLRRPKA